MIRGRALVGACAFSALSASVSLGAPALITVATFNTTNGATPAAGLIADASGNLYGTTSAGGSGDLGTVFKVASGTHALTTVATFNTTNGSHPVAGLISDGSGNLYGTTYDGGAGYYGTVFKIAAATNNLTTVFSFNGANGANPYAGLLIDDTGNLYGTTSKGGSATQGTVFKITGTNTLSTLATFVGTNGSAPEADLIADGSGNLYGTTSSGGPNNGTVFKVTTATNTLSTLAVFNGTNGKTPYAGLVADQSGNLYGTTAFGGSSSVGNVFKIATGTNTLSTLATFSGANGSSPYGGLIADASGNFYGTTYSGGSGNVGTIFKLTAGTNTLSTLASFNTTNGSGPEGNLIADASGNLYGTTYSGGSSGYGTVFELTNTGFAVPEPTSLALAGISSLTLLRRRRQALISAG